MTDPAPPKIDSRSAFQAAIRWGFEASIAAASRRILIADRDFAEWPLDDVALHAALAGWLRLPKRRLVMLGTDFDAVHRLHPRFVRWRADWVHAIDALSPPAEDRAELPTLFVDDGLVSVQLIDAVHWRGRAERDARTALSWREGLDAVLQRSEPSFPANRLGL